MVAPLAPNDLVTLEALAISTMWETLALVELLKRKGILRPPTNGDGVRESIHRGV
jgi:hypothetical protein